MRNYITAIILLILLPFIAMRAQAQVKEDEVLKSNPPKVVVTLKPLHSMVAEVMGDIGTPVLLMDGKIQHEHDYSLKPSDMVKLQEADVVFFISMDLETFMVKAVSSLKKNAIAVELASAEGVSHLEADDDHGHDDHNHGVNDPHIWLSPENAVAMVNNIKKILIVKDPANRGLYEMNARKYIDKISAASEKIVLKLAPYKNIPFIVAHDAYGYFVKQYGLNQVGSFAASPEIPLSAAQISRINSLFEKQYIYCVFADPAFSGATLKKSLNHPERVKIGILDPIGVDVKPGQDAYITILNNVADGFLGCVGNGNG